MSPAPRRLVAILDPSGPAASEAAGAAVAWWSVTKPVIATAALRLVAQKRLALDAPLPGERPSLRLLLAHRAGLGDYGGLPAYREAVARGDPPWTFAQMRAYVEAGDPTRPTCADFRYSNLGYALVGRAIAAAAERPLAEALHALVLAPLGLAGVRLAETPDDLAETALPPPRGYHPGHVHHGVLVGPIVEAARAIRAIATGALLPAALAQALRAREPLPFGPLPGRPWVGPGYGLGLMEGTRRDATSGREIAAAGHSAGGPGSTGAVYHAPGSGRTVAVFSTEASEGVAETHAAALLAAA